jgi:hypothetical protein
MTGEWKSSGVTARRTGPTVETGSGSPRKAGSRLCIRPVFFRGISIPTGLPRTVQSPSGSVGEQGALVGFHRPGPGGQFRTCTPGRDEKRPRRRAIGMEDPVKEKIDPDR